MAPLLRLLQGVEQGCVHPLWGTGIQTQALGNLVRCAEADARQLTEPVRMVFQDVQGIFAKLPVELHRPAGADPVGR